MEESMEENISELKEQIYFARTKEYFEEVERSYYSRNYKSAVVMLYSVVIADLLYKLEELKDYYSDKTAEKILDEINVIRTNNPKSSEWENQLIDKIRKNTQILEPYVIVNIEHLKDIRNFSAHRSLNQDNELINPSKEKTMGFIKDMLIGIFIRPSLFIKKITDNILEDISSKKEDFLQDNSKFEEYICKKYFTRMNENMIISVFKDFWKLTFKLENEECNENRDINLEFLLIVVRKYKLNILEDIGKNSEKYNNISENSEVGVFIVKFLYYNPEIYFKLNDQNKILINLVINKKIEYKLLAYYTYKNFEEQLNDVSLPCFKKDDFKEMFEKKIMDSGFNVLLIDKYIYFFSQSINFDSADYNFDKFIKNYIGMMKFSQIENLLESINNNNQLYNRGRALNDNNLIIKEAKIDWKKIDFEKYPKFKFDDTWINDLPF